MLRVRFHGRGGHGVKTASRILGTAAFMAGLQAQDSPLYGAERRGAPVAAFARISHEPIRERGVILAPDLILIGDETLLADPGTGALAGARSASCVFVNSAREGREIASQHNLACPVVTLNLTAQALDILGRRSALSAPLGAVACALAGLIPADVMERATCEELADLGLAADTIEKNIELARQTFTAVPAIGPFHAPASLATPALHVPAHLPGPEGLPILYTTGNAAMRHTGSWRIFRPVIDRDACTRCGICLLRCPDGAITADDEGYPVIDYENCKGCMLCLEECPIHCIGEQKEVQAW